MQDKLEDFIRNNKDQFDTAEPDNKVWNKIEKGLDGEKNHGPNWYWKIAVAVLLVAVAYLAGDKYLVQQQPAEELSTLQEFKELESFYTSMISEKKLEVSQEMTEEDFFNYLETDIQALDDLYEELKTSFQEEQETPQMKSALVHLLRQKLHLINKQLDMLEERKNQQAETEETEGISSL